MYRIVDTDQMVYATRDQYNDARRLAGKFRDQFGKQMIVQSNEWKDIYTTHQVSR